MKLENIISHTEFQRNNKKFNDLLEKDDVVVVKNNKPSFVAVKAENYKKYKDVVKVISDYKYKLSEIIIKIQHSKKSLERDGVTHIYIFGSYARGEETINSDLDILFDTEKEGFDGFLAADRIMKLLPNIKVNTQLAKYAKQSFIDSIRDKWIKVF